MKKLALTLAVSCAFISSSAFAWGNDGHRAVGAIADKLLKGTAAQKQIQALLLPGETLESIANWPDCVKGTYCGPQSPEMIAYVAANPKHSEYHYTDVPYQLNKYEDHAVGTADDDIVQTLRQAIAVLQGKNGAAVNPHNFTPRQALILIVHLAGDIHQPLHVGAAFVGKDGKFVVPTKQADIDGINIFDARGGNNFLLDDGKLTAISSGVIPPGEPKPVKEGVPAALTKPFHSYWDTTVVDYAMRRLSTRTPEQFAQAVIDSKPNVNGRHHRRRHREDQQERREIQHLVAGSAAELPGAELADCQGTADPRRVPPGRIAENDLVVSINVAASEKAAVHTV